MFVRRKYIRRPIRRRPVIRRRRPAISRPIRRRQVKLYNFKRTCELTNIATTPSVSPCIFTYQFKFSDLPNTTDFSGLFDQYRIKGVKITFYPVSNVAYSTSASAAPMPIGEFYTVLDFDDAGTPANLNELLQYGTLRRSYFNRPHKRYLKPLATQSGVYQAGGVTTGYRSLPSSTWFDMANIDVLYYGIKGAYSISDSSLMIKETIRVTATYYFQLRMVR
jgi:hypothetical protein